MGIELNNSQNVMSPLDAWFAGGKELRAQAWEKLGLIEYQGMLVSFTTVVSSSWYENECGLKLSDGKYFKFDAESPYYAALKYPGEGKDPFSDLKIAIVKTPDGHYPIDSFFEEPDAYLVLIESKGEWHPFQAVSGLEDVYDHYGPDNISKFLYENGN